LTKEPTSAEQGGRAAVVFLHRLPDRRRRRQLRRRPSSGGTGCLNGSSIVGNFAIASGNRSLQRTQRPGDDQRLRQVHEHRRFSHAQGRRRRHALDHNLGDHSPGRGHPRRPRRPESKDRRRERDCITAGDGFETTPANVAWRLTLTHVRAHNCGIDNHEDGIYLRRRATPSSATTGSTTTRDGDRLLPRRAGNARRSRPDRRQLDRRVGRFPGPASFIGATAIRRSSRFLVPGFSRNGHKQ
jgi:hypothetical protein